MTSVPPPATAFIAPPATAARANPAISNPDIRAAKLVQERLYTSSSACAACHSLALSCRKCHSHPEVLKTYRQESLAEALEQKAMLSLGRSIKQLPGEEAAFLGFSHQRRKAKNPLVGPLAGIPGQTAGVALGIAAQVVACACTTFSPFFTPCTPGISRSTASIQWAWCNDSVSPSTLSQPSLALIFSLSRGTVVSHWIAS